MEGVTTWQWIELWVVTAGPFVGYLLTAYYAFKLQHRPHRHVYWRWSFLHLQLVLAGACLLRVKVIVALWQAGRAGATMVIDPEWAVAGWAVSLGLLGHVVLLDRHPAWELPEEERNI